MGAFAEFEIDVDVRVGDPKIVEVRVEPRDDDAVLAWAKIAVEFRDHQPHLRRVHRMRHNPLRQRAAQHDREKCSNHTDAAQRVPPTAAYVVL